MKSDWRSMAGILLLFLTAAAVSLNSALGQPPWGGRGPEGYRPGDRGPGPPGWGDRGSGPPRQDDHSRDSHSGGDRSSSDDAERRLRWYGEIMRNWDSNGNGMIDAEEVSTSSMRKSYAERIIGEAGLEPKFPVPISKIQEGLSKRAGGSSSSSSSGGSSAGSKVPGFGVESKEPAPPGFGRPDAVRSDSDRSGNGSRDSSGYSGSNHSSHSGGSSAEGSDRLREHARSLIRQYDKNDSGVLEKDEWSQMHRSHWSADRDHDGKITESELIRWLEDYSRSRSDWGSSRHGGSSGSDNPPTYRLLTAVERLPGELPGWFSEKDANGDGQVTMAEYESDWTDAKADEFARLDPNNDGVITPRECLAAEKEE